MRPCAAVLVLITVALPLAASRAHADALPGVVLSFESPDGKQSDSRKARLIALAVPHDSAPTPFITPGPFRATFHGLLNLSIRDQYTFRASGRGEFELFINGESVLKSAGEDLSATPSRLVKLKKGPNELVVHYTAPATGDALVRLCWAPRDKPFDPIPPTVLTHEADPILEQQSQLREGRELIATRRCMRCHQLPEAMTPHDGSMPELTIDAPILDDVGSRLNPQWMARWIADPRSMRNDATMPEVFAPADAKSSAADIAAYLATRKAVKSQASGPIDQSDGSVVAGERLFLSLGCIACHSVPRARMMRPVSRCVGFGTNSNPMRFGNSSRSPNRISPGTRMPNFALSDDEATHVAAFLLKTAPAEASGAIALTAENPEHGKQLFESKGCAKCHAPDVKSVAVAKPVTELMKGDFSKGCMSADASGRDGAPDFGFNELQRDAIRAFARTDWSSLTHDPAPEFLERQIRSVQCVACHTRDSEQDRWSSLATEIAAIQQSLPPEPQVQTEQIRPLLTWTGDKLETDWMSAFIAGTVDYKPRPWLKARMPSFASRQMPRGRLDARARSAIQRSA